MKTAPRRRSGFTLLEVLLASLIAVILMAALYFAMDATLRQTQESRSGIDVSMLSRGVYTRMSIDLSASLGPLPPKSGGNTSSQTAPTADSTTPTDPTMTTTPSTTGTTTTTPTDPTMSTAAVDPTTGEAVAAPQAADVAFQAGVIGTDKQLTVFISRLPSAFMNPRGLGAVGDGQASDIVRITYWLSQSGGLCRQERPWVTADGVRNSTDPDLTDEAGDTLVQEVKDVTFEYCDPGGNWLPSWDGSQMSPDGVTPIGPPRAVKVTLKYELPPARKNDPPLTRSLVQVLPVRAAPGGYTPEMITPSTDTGAADPTMTGTTTNMSTTPSTSTPSTSVPSTSTPTGGGK
jgi:prepilin-type N-terminal cleavage/methylation domain-containing protein